LSKKCLLDLIDSDRPNLKQLNIVSAFLDAAGDRDAARGFCSVLSAFLAVSTSAAPNRDVLREEIEARRDAENKARCAHG
jgi:hypothetical protein